MFFWAINSHFCPLFVSSPINFVSTLFFLRKVLFWYKKIRKNTQNALEMLNIMYQLIKCVKNYGVDTDYLLTTHKFVKLPNFAAIRHCLNRIIANRAVRSKVYNTLQMGQISLGEMMFVFQLHYLRYYFVHFLLLRLVECEYSHNNENITDQISMGKL